MSFKVAIALESQHPRPRARALALGRRLAGQELIATACLVDTTADGAAFAARLAVQRAAFVADAALAKAGSRARAQVLARLLARLELDLVLVDAGDDGGGGLFSATLAHEAQMNGIFGLDDLEADPSNARAVLATLDVGGMRQRLRIDLPAVVSIRGEHNAAPASDPASVESHVVCLDDLALAPDQLIAEPIPGVTFVPTYRRATTVTDIDDLL
ncbi:MAG TPA: hypothetical protein VGG33_27080 [Polyangia bacterium]